QQVLAAASVAGGTFAPTAAPAGPALGIEAGEGGCGGLGGQPGVRAGGTGGWGGGAGAVRHAFPHVLFQHGGCERPGLRRRAQRPERIGGWREAGYGPQAQALAAELALHFERGGESRRAVQYYQRAAATAAQRAAPHVVAATLTRALDLLRTWPETAE